MDMSASLQSQNLEKQKSCHITSSSMSSISAALGGQLTILSEKNQSSQVKRLQHFVHSSVLVNDCSYIEQEPTGRRHPIGNVPHKFLSIMRRFVHTPTICHGSKVGLSSSGGVQRDRIRNSLNVHENGFYVSCERQIPSVQDRQIDRSPNV